jgi:hypothetical protein
VAWSLWRQKTIVSIEEFGGPTVKRSRIAISGAIGVLAVIACKSSSLADSLDARLLGAWTTSQADCSKLFVRKGGAFFYRQPIDKFAQAAIIDPQQIRAPAGVCRVQRVSHANAVVKFTAQCSDSISYIEQTFEIKLMSGGEISYSPTGDPSVNTTLIKCAM